MQLLLDHGADINDGREDHVWTPLMMAASEGHIEAMTMLLKRQSGSADINACASEDGTALTLAIACGEADAVSFLIRNNADPNLTGPGMEPPLALAASTGNETLVKMIMDAGGYQNTTSPAYGSALAAAASSSNLQILQTVFQADRSSPSRQSALEQAAAVTSKEIVDYLLRSGPGLQCDTAFTKAATKGADDILDMLWQYSRGAISQQSKDLSLYTATDFELSSTVKLLLAMRASPDAEGEGYGTALTAAAYDGTIDLVTMLLDAGAHIRHPAGYPLQAAASQGHNDMVTLLLSRGANVNEMSPKHDSGTALHAACVSGFGDTVDLLLSHRADPNLGSGTLSCPIIAATRNANSRIVKMLVDAGVNVNVFGGPDNSTPLINAAMKLPVASLKTLVERGHAFVNQVNKDFDTALKISAVMGDDECVGYLLGIGADVFHREGHNGTALHAAAAQGSADCCRLLLAHRASPSVSAGPYHSVIQAAASSGDVETMKLILGADPQLDVNVRGGKHGTPLHAAAMQSDTRCLKMLLDKGADANVVIGEHGTVLQTAAFTGCNKNVGILIEHGADVNAVAGKHGTALQAAALKCTKSTLQALLNAGAKLEVDDGKNTPQSKKNGKYGSALAAAAARWDTEPLEFLLEKEGWSTGTTGAYRQALETAAKYNYHDLFRLIVRSKGGKTIPKKVKSKLRHEVRKRDETDDGDDNSDFGDDVVFNEQDSDDEESDYEDSDDDEEEEEDKDENKHEDEHEDEYGDKENGDMRVQEPRPAPPAAVMQGRAGTTGQGVLGNLSRPQTNKIFGSNDYDPPPGYGSVPQAQFSPPPSSTFQPPNLVIGRQPLENQQQEHTTGGHNQAYGQTSRAPEVKPQYRAYNIDTPPAPSAYQTYISNGPNAATAYHPYNSNGKHEYAQNRDTVGYTSVGGTNQARSPDPQFGGYVASEHKQGDRIIQDNAGYNQHAYAARSDKTTATINSPDATASSRHNSYQQTSRNMSSNYNNNYVQQSQLHQPSASDSGNATPRYDAQSRGSYDSRDPTNYNTHTPSSCAAPQDSYADYQYSPPSQQQSRGFEPQHQPSGSFNSQPQQPRGSEPQPQRYGGLSRKPVPTQIQAPSSNAGAVEDEKSHDHGGLDRYSRYSSGYDVSQYRNY
jgi:ankyrin repeat protein